MNLEESLKEVKELKYDLSAEKVVQEEKGHYEIVSYLGAGGGGGIDRERIYENDWIVDEPRVYAPNQEKREAAKIRLDNIYEASDYFTIMYAAGDALNIDNLDAKTDLFIDELEKRTDEKARIDLERLSSIVKIREQKERIGEILGKSQADIIADCSSYGLTKKEWETVYHEASDMEDRRKASFRLDKTPIEFCYDQYPLTTISIGLAGIGALAYGIITSF